MVHRHVLLLLALVAATAEAQPLDASWPTTIFLGSLWRTGTDVPMGDTSYVEPGLRPLIPTPELEDLRFSRHPDGESLAQNLADAAGFFEPARGTATPPITTDSLLLLLATGHSHAVDRSAYMRLRLFDLLLGDWSRTTESYLWYADPSPSGTTWIPHPAAYRNAFSRYNGLVPWSVLQSSDFMTTWSDDPRSTLNRKSPMRPLDRRFLSTEDWALWESATTVLAGHLTAPVIDSVFRSYSGPGLNELRASFGHRVQNLHTLAQQFYRDLSRFIEFHDIPDGDSIYVLIRSRDVIEVRTNGREGPVRTLNGVATDEVRFLLLDRKNSIWVEGPDDLSFDMIVDAGDGTSRIFQRRHAFQEWSERVPRSFQVYKTPARERVTDRDDAWGSRVVFVPWVTVNRDDHLFIGGGPEFTTSAYHTFPYATRTTFLGGVASRTGKIRLRGAFEDRTLFRGFSIGLEAEFSQLHISNFFGLGNETEAPEDLLSGSYFKADQRIFALSFPLRMHVSDIFSMGLTVTSQAVRTTPRTGSLLDSLIGAGYLDRLSYRTIGIDALYDSRDRSAIPTSGMFASARATWHPVSELFGTPFTTITIESRYYVYLDRMGSHILLQTSGSSVLGEHPWFESAFLGGSQSLRGFERQRFAGDAMLSGAIEARLPLGRLHVLWPFDAGALAFTETGRVFLRHERSSLWHTSAGAGVWLRPARSPYTMVVSVAVSKELVEFLATFGLPVRD